MSESALYGFALAAAQLSSLLLWPMYTRLFSAEDLGVLVLAITVLTLLSILATAGMDNSAHRWYWETQDLRDRQMTLSTWFWSQLVVASTLSIVLVVGLVVLHGLGQLGGLEFRLYLWLAALIPLRGSMVVLNNWFRMQRKPLTVLGINLGMMLLMVGITIYVLLIQKRGLTGIFEAQVYAHVVVMVMAAPMLRDVASFKHFSWQRLHEMLLYALPLLPAGLAGWMLTLSDRWLVDLFLNNEQVALYQMAAILAMAIGFPVSAFQQAWGPFALSIYQRPEAIETYALVARVFTILATAMAFLVGLLAPEIAALVFSPQYKEAGSSVIFLAFAQVLVGLYYIAAIGCNIVKQTTPIAIALFVGAGVQVAGNIFLLPLIGRDGAALAALLAQFVMVGLLFVQAQRQFFIPYYFMEMVGVLLIGLVLGMLGRHLPLGFQLGVVSCVIVIGGFATISWLRLSQRRTS